MTPAEVAATLRQFNGWRRDFDDKFEQSDPHEVSEAIDAAVEMIERLEAAEKSDAESLAMYRRARDERDALRASLEAAESECREQARLNGMGSEREAALMAKLEAAEKDAALKEEVIDSLAAVVKRLDAQCDAAERERDECNRRRLEAADHFAAQTALMKKKCDALRAEIEELHVLIAAVKKQADAEFCLRVKKEEEYTRLRAKVADMEKQEPVAWMHETRRDSDVVTDAVKHVWGKAAVGSMAAYSIPLYALPGAQPAPSVPSGLHPLETVRFWADAYTHPGDDNFRGHGMAAALLREYAELRAALAAAPEAKP